ncbi:UrcA family protein [Novosphingobium sp. BL-8A]|uniref:UrcA family protein n=1 Tax=Novosphingobium sp. BL-8A TaxID=3127639 RepID=UPI00375654CC
MSRNSMIAAAILAGATLGFAASAVADEVVVKNPVIDPSVPRVLVRYDDLNLETQAGRDHLTTRLDSAVRTVCGKNVDVRDLDEFASMMGCRDDSSQRAYAARDQVFAQYLAARAQGQTLAASAMPQTLAVFARR